LMSLLWSQKRKKQQLNTNYVTLLSEMMKLWALKLSAILTFITITRFPAVSLAANENLDKSQHTIGVVGLGLMGKAIVECYASQPHFQVHAWNRGESRRRQVRDLNIDNVKVHDTLEDFLAATEDIVIMAIFGGEDLQNANALLRQSNLWKGKTLVQYSAHEPTSAQEHNKLVSFVGGELIAGAMMAVPSWICHEGTFFVSSTNTSTLDKVMPVLKPMGTIVRFDEDIGLASLADIGILQTLHFGVTGHEMAHLLMERYGASKKFREQFVDLTAKIAPPFLKETALQVSKGILSKNWKEAGETGDSVAIVLDVFSIHLSFFRKMGIPNDTYLDS